MLTLFGAIALGDLLVWCASCADSTGVPAAVGIAAGVAGALGAAGGIPAANPAPGPGPNPSRGDEPPLPTGDSHAPPGTGAASGPLGYTVVHTAGGVTVTTPGGVTVSGTDTGGGTYSAMLPDGSVLAGNANGTSTLTTVDGSTYNYNAAGQSTGSAPPDLAAGGGVDAPPLHHDVTAQTSDGGYTVSHPDGSVDVHRPDGSAIHVEKDGSTWHKLP